MSGLGSTISHDPKKIASVATVDDLNNYPVGLRQWGLRVVVTADNLVRELVYLASSDLLSDNANWVLDGGATNSTNAEIYSKRKSIVGGPAIAQAHQVLDVNNGPVNAVFHVEATIVAMADGGTTGGSLKIAATFKKSSLGVISQIGVTETIFGPEEDLSGAFSASFSTSGGASLSCDTSAAAGNVNTHVEFLVITVTNDL